MSNELFWQAVALLTACQDLEQVLQALAARMSEAERLRFAALDEARRCAFLKAMLAKYAPLVYARAERFIKWRDAALRAAFEAGNAQSVRTFGALVLYAPSAVPPWRGALEPYPERDGASKRAYRVVPREGCFTFAWHTPVRFESAPLALATSDQWTLATLQASDVYETGGQRYQVLADGKLLWLGEANDADDL